MSIYDQIGAAPGTGSSARSWLGALRGLRRGPGVQESARGLVAQWQGWWGGRSPRGRRVLGVLAACVVAGGGIGAYLALRPTPQPDYTLDDLDDVFSFTLLSDEFNELPIEERVKLMGQLIQRLKTMSASDSMLLGAFASGISGQARQQLERNASKLAIDVWDKYAKDYATVPDEARGEYLDKTYVEFTKMMEAVTGTPRDISDEDRLKEGKRQADRDRKRMAESNRQASGEELGRFFGFLTGNVGGNASAQQRVRGQQMMRDMVRRFRGQDPSTGKPTGGG